MPLCACGKCGLECKPGNQFIHGHHMVLRTGSKNHMFGKKRPEHSKKLLGNNNPMYGKKRLDLVERNKLGKGRKESVDTKKKKSDAMKGKKNPFFNKSHSLLTKQKIAESNSRRDYSKENRHYENVGRISGTFLGVRFSSSCELAFLIWYCNTYGTLSYLIRSDSKGWRHLKIPYINIYGKKSWYYPEFYDLIWKGYYEIKPIGFRNSKFLYGENEKRKEEGAILHTRELKLSYEIKQTPSLDKYKVIFPMRQKGEITLTPRWEKQYHEWSDNK